jgi:rubrerythrin
MAAPSHMRAPVVVARAAHAGERLPLTRFSCAHCTYGAASRVAPERCPMCGGTVWAFETGRARRAVAVL